MGLGSDLDEDCMGRWFVDLTGSPSGNAKVDLFATPGRRPRNMGFGGDLDEDCVGREFVDHDWITFGQSEGRSGCYARAAAPERVVCFCGACRLVSCGRRVASSVYLFCTVCIVFGPGLPYKLVNSILSIRAVDIDHLELKKGYAYVSQVQVSGAPFASISGNGCSLRNGIVPDSPDGPADTLSLGPIGDAIGLYDL